MVSHEDDLSITVQIIICIIFVTQLFFTVYSLHNSDVAGNQSLYQEGFSFNVTLSYIADGGH